MGLCINFEFHAPKVKTLAEARKYIAKLHKFAKTLGFQDVSKIVTWKAGKDDPRLADLFTYYLWDETKEADSDSPIYGAKPTEIIFFSIRQEGSESGMIGLATHEQTAEECNTGEKRPTKLIGWNWRHFCKTQYASSTQAGGFDNFFMIHDGLCRVFDEAKRVGLGVKVTDEGKYFEDRNKEKLRAEINKWNGMIAAVAGQLKDAYGAKAESAIVAPITEDPEFERMEARGQKLLGVKMEVKIVRHNPRKK